MSPEAGSLSEDVGEIHIAVYRATVVKKKTPSAVTNFPVLTADETEMESVSLVLAAELSVSRRGLGVELMSTEPSTYHVRRNDLDRTAH